jgi:hypothetical protein
MMSPAIGMVMIVRDELELIGANIEFHSRQGFDRFVIMDNASQDGTRDELERLSKTFPIEILDQPNTDFNQSAWTTELATHLLAMGIDWGITLDADEFVSSANRTLKEALTQTMCKPAIASRQNVIPTEYALRQDGFDSLSGSRYRVEKPLGEFNFAADSPSAFPVVMRSLPGKVFFPLKGLKSVHAGGHDVDHETVQRHLAEDVLVRHYPVRRFAHFLRRLDHWEQRFKQRPAERGQSVHIRRWLRLRSAGLLDLDYNQFAVAQDQLEEHVLAGTLVEDDFGERLRSSLSRT